MIPIYKSEPLRYNVFHSCKEVNVLNNQGFFIKLIVIFNIILVVFMTGCQGNNSSSQTEHRLTIYTSVYPLQFLTESITGHTAHVHTIYPPGVDAHTYEPTLKEMTNIAKSDLLIYFGEGMESFSEKVAQSLVNQNIHLIEMGKHQHLFSSTSHHDIDPHIWLDPLRMIEMAKIIKQQLTQLSPEHEAEFKQNYDKLTDELTLLDEQFVNTLKNKTNKDIIVSHAAYEYWEERYGINQVPISGVTSTDEPSQKELVQIVKDIQERQLNYIIFDQTGEHRLSNIIKDHTNTKKRTIHDLEVLTEEDIEQNEDYLSLMKKNLQTLDEVTS